MLQSFNLYSPHPYHTLLDGEEMLLLQRLIVGTLKQKKLVSLPASFQLEPSLQSSNCYVGASRLKHHMYFFFSLIFLVLALGRLRFLGYNCKSVIMDLLDRLFWLIVYHLVGTKGPDYWSSEYHPSLLIYNMIYLQFYLQKKLRKNRFIILKYLQNYAVGSF